MGHVLPPSLSLRVLYLPLPLSLCLFLSLSLSPVVSAACLSLVPLPPLRALSCFLFRRCRTYERALPFLRLCRSRPVSLSRRLCRVPSAVSFLAVVGRTNACCPVCVVAALDPSLCRATSAACPRLSFSRSCRTYERAFRCSRLSCARAVSLSRYLSSRARSMFTRAPRTTRSLASVVTGKGGGGRRGFA